jgi:catechol 2,3-dioxygenase-like lactoylglutathione lyase family enzyme
MLDHVTIRVSELASSRHFYGTVLGSPSSDDEFVEWDDFSIVQASDAEPSTRHLHVAFAARSREEVEAFWHSGVGAGYRSDGEPGPRPQYAEGYYGAFLLDPDGNSVESVTGHRGSMDGPPVDHLWLGVADAARSRRFYETIAPVLGLRVSDASRPGLVSVASGNRHLMLVADGRPPTENLHLAFPAADDEQVAAFHRAATAAGYRDNGGPGERRRYHPGYVAAFVLDPDGTNVEAVNHNR